MAALERIKLSPDDSKSSMQSLHHRAFIKPGSHTQNRTKIFRLTAEYHTIRPYVNLKLGRETGLKPAHIIFTIIMSGSTIHRLIN